jgi:hypothetical protein
MSVAFEGNAYIDGGKVLNLDVTNVTLNNSIITKSSIDMLDTSGSLQKITNVKDPTSLQDAATKQYVDNLTIKVLQVTLVGITETIVSTELYGSRTIYVTNIITNGPSAIFTISKNNSAKQPHVCRLNSSRGVNSTIYLNVLWNESSGITLKKTGSMYDGLYLVKIV